MSSNVPTTVAAEHRTVSRVMGLIEAVVGSEPDGLRLGELAATLDAPKSSVHGLAKGLVARGYLHEQDGKYFAGSAISLLATAQVDERHDRAIADQMRILWEKWNETVMESHLTGDSVVYFKTLESSRTLRTSIPVHTRVPLWPTSSGKSFLAFMSDRRRDSVLDRAGVAAGERETALDELREVRQSRISMNLGGTEVGMCGVASPIIIAGHPVTRAIAVGAPLARMSDHLEELGLDVRAAAEALSGTLV